MPDTDAAHDAHDPLENWAPTGIDVTVPGIARTYDFLLGGTDTRA